jgi:hypothetical protein
MSLGTLKVIVTVSPLSIFIASLITCSLGVNSLRVGLALIHKDLNIYLIIYSFTYLIV